jgi:hypothetical protein
VDGDVDRAGGACGAGGCGGAKSAWNGALSVESTSRALPANVASNTSSERR